jgi:hypothetical protein
MAGSAKLPGLMGVVDRLLLEAAACREDESCREYVRTCVVGTLLSEALMRIALSKNEIPVEELYETVASQIIHGDILHNYRDFMADMLDRIIEYLEMGGEIKNGMATRFDLLKMASHVEVAMIFLGCWTT